MGLVHVDAHTDTGDQALGEKIYHGTPFRRCVEEGLLDCKRVIQIGIRGSSYAPDPYKYSRDQVSLKLAGDSTCQMFHKACFSKKISIEKKNCLC